MLNNENFGFPAFEHEPLPPVKSNKVKINWRNPCCGGKLVHGTENCRRDEDTGVWRCACVDKPKNFDYEVHHIVATYVLFKNLHLEKSGDKWDECISKLFQDGALKTCVPISGKNLKERFFKNMIKNTQERHALGDSAGFETHPDVTPYDALMLKMMKEIESVEAKKKFLKGKKAVKQSSMLSHESDLCPEVNLI